MYKNKTNNQNNMQEMSNREISPRPINNKPRKTKENKIQTVNTQTGSSKIKHKPNSKSNLESIQQKHNNSPIQFHQQQIQNKCINAFSFTHILQKNNKSQHLSSSSIDQQHMQNSSRFNLKASDFNKKTTIGSITLTPNTFLTSLQRDATVKDSLQESSKNIQHRLSAKQEQSKSIPKSVDKQNKKSPLKLVNLNRLSNTPKLKERKQAKAEQKQIQKDNQSGKTFKAVLSNNRQAKQNKIEVNLQCLQKIQSMFNQSQQLRDKQPNPHASYTNSKSNLQLRDNQPYPHASYTNSKSNLLSTGVINISHPQDHMEAVHHPINTGNSKQSFSSKCQAQKTVSQQLIQQFKEQNEAQNSNIYELPLKIQHLRDRVLLLQSHFATQLNNQNENKFMMDIHSHYNPQVNENKGIDNYIKKLITFKEQLLIKISGIMHCLSSFSEQMVRHINQIVIIYQQSAKSQIDWKQIEQIQNRRTMLQIQKVKTDIMLDRLIHHQWTVKQIINKYSNCDQQHVSLQSNIQQLQKQIQIQQHYIKYRQPAMMRQTMLTQIFNQQFDTLQTKVHALHQTLLTLKVECPNLVTN